MKLAERFATVQEREQYRQKMIGIAMKHFVNKIAVHVDTREREKKEVTNRFLQYQDDAVGFAEDVLGYYLYSKQREICKAIVEHDRVAVQSAHETGKSFLSGGVIVPWWIACHEPKEAMVVTTAPTYSQVRTILWKEVNRAHARGRLPGYTNQVEWLIDKELVAFGRKPDDNSPAAFQGIHARYLLVVLDEACGVPVNLWNAAESLVANIGGKILAIGNPDDPNTEFGRICKPGSGWHVITVSAFDTPNLTGEDVPEYLKHLLISQKWVDERAHGWGVTSPIYKSKVLGEFPETSEDTLIQPKWVADAVHRELDVDEDEPNELGVDVARSENGNETVIYHRHGRKYRLWKALRTKDTMRVVGLVVQAVIETGATKVKVDDPGVGGGVTDRLKELSRQPSIDEVNPMYGIRVIGVNVGAKPIERRVDKRHKLDPAKRYKNLKSQLSWELREMFRTGEIDLGPDMDTQAQACEIRYDVLSNGLLYIESKDDVRERLTKLGGMTGESGSPDRWDALVLASADVDDKPEMAISDSLLLRSRIPTGRAIRPRY